VTRGLAIWCHVSLPFITVTTVTCTTAIVSNCNSLEKPLTAFPDTTSKAPSLKDSAAKKKDPADGGIVILWVLEGEAARRGGNGW
jgi:hypothetical protein